jgi:two-component system osmolarity sensor histidine kinase EnvZ
MSFRPFQLLKKILPQGLYWRSLMIIVLPMVMLQAVVTYVFMERHWQMVTEALSQSAVSDIAMLLSEYEMSPTTETAARISSQASRYLSMSVAFLPDEALPESNADYEGLLDRSLADEIRLRISHPFWLDTARYDDYVDIRIAYDGGVMRALPLRSHVYAANSHIFIVWMVAASFVLIFVALLFLRNQIRPIERLAEAAEDFGMGRDLEKFKPQGASEVRRAALAFMQMRERIRAQIEQRTAMLAGVSHDLRTPLTRFKLQLAMLKDSPEIEELRTDVSEMEQMLEAYLDFVRGDPREVSQVTDLSDLLKEIQFDAQRKGQNVGLETHGELELLLRRNAFKRCLTNIVDNAGKYAGEVWVTAVRDGSDIDIIVDDNGAGIPDEQLEEVFRPFYRLDEARNLDEGGTGLGLAIARDIARGHGGDIQLARSPMGGLRAVIHVPV